MKPVQTGDVLYKLLERGQTGECVTFIWENFTRHVPLAKIFKLPPEELRERHKRLTVSLTRTGASIGAFDTASGEMVGIMLNSIQTPTSMAKSSKPDYTSIADCSATEAFKNYARFMIWIKHGDLDAIGSKISLGKHIVAVDPRFRRRGIGGQLMRLSDVVAKELGCDSTVCVAASAFTCKALERDGKAILLWEVKFSDYVDPVTGKKPNLELSEVHSHVKVFYVRL